MIVIDASAAVALLLNEDHAFAVMTPFAILTGEAVVAPSHWPAEVGNALVISVRRGRIGLAEIRSMTDQLEMLGIQIEAPPGFSEIATIADTATSLNLTYYDAAYVHTAQMRQASLFTFDRRMREAASRLGIPVLPQETQ